MPDVSAYKSIYSNRGKTELTRLNTRKPPDYDLISGLVLKQQPRKTIVLLTVVFNRMLTFPILWKYAEIIMIPMPAKPPHEPTSYRPVSLLPSQQAV